MPGYWRTKGVCSAEELERKVSAQSVDIVFGRHVAEAERIVRRGIRVPLNQAQFDALCSLAFNVGEGRVIDTFILVNSGNFPGAAANISKMIKVLIIKNGTKKYVVAPGLIKRRTEESAPFRVTSFQQINAN